MSEQLGDYKPLDLVTEEDYKKSKLLIFQMLSSLQRHVLEIETGFESCKVGGFERCRDHIKLIDNVSEEIKTINEKVDNHMKEGTGWFSKINIIQLVTLLVLIFGIFSGYSKMKTNMDVMVSQTNRMEKQMDKIDTTMDLVKDRVIRLETIKK